ncbi:MAG: RNA-directed DNA polymerase [Parcubacteria group bacterium Gr01-1014_106]|nr:MAG: RNA-directed DNA polymerase [Parcubacteria group bacterium Gr01-1014_106]
MSPQRWGGGDLAENSARRTGVPIGSVTSQLFANIYLDAFDHYSKERLGIRYYLRYTDDVLLLHHDRETLLRLLAPMRDWLWHERRLMLHPHKIILRKLSQGIDFLGYVVLPHHTLLRTRTKRRMIRRISEKNASSYLGLLQHATGHELSVRLIQKLRLRQPSADR